MLLALKRWAAWSVFKPSACDFGLSRKNLLCLLCLPFSDKCGWLVTLHDREMSGLEMGSVTKEAGKYFGALWAPNKCRKLGLLLKNIVFVFTGSWDRSSVTPYILFQRNFTASVIGHIQKNMGILVQISVLIYVGTYSCTYLPPKMTCTWPMRLTKICLLQLINLYKWHRTAILPCSLYSWQVLYYWKCIIHRYRVL